MLLILFIRMISAQILSLEENDILVLRSRGATKLQVFILYLQQSGIIAFAGCVLGIVLGYIMCRAAASTDGFLRFTAKNIGTYRFVWQMLVYAVAAAVIMVLFITVPVWKKSKDAISEHSRGRISKEKASLGEMLYRRYTFGSVSISALQLQQAEEYACDICS